jgi:hypothetical protein
MKEGGKPLEAYSQEQDDMRRQAVSDCKERYIRFGIWEELDSRRDKSKAEQEAKEKSSE